MGEARQAKGSQKKPGQRAEELPATGPSIRWAATGEQKLLGRKKSRQCFLHPLETSSTADPLKTMQGKTMQTKTAEISV